MSLLKQPYEVSSEFYMKALVYGQPGIGKSTLALSMPNAVLIDCDNGVHRISPQHRRPYLPVSSYDEIQEVIASPDMAEFQTIVVDTAGKLLDYMAQWIIKKDPKMGRKDGALTLQGFGVRKYEFINFLKRISIMKKHIIFVAHEIEEKRGDDRVCRPEIGGSSSADLVKELDAVGYMEAIGRKRTISFSPSDKYYAKNSAHLQDVIEIPELKGDTANDFMGKILQSCREAISQESGKLKEYNALMETIGKEINAVATLEDANKYLATLAKKAHIWDSKIKAWGMMQVRASELSLEYDKKEKKYVPNQSNAA